MIVDLNNNILYCCCAGGHIGHRERENGFLPPSNFEIFILSQKFLLIHYISSLKLLNPSFYPSQKLKENTLDYPL